MNNAINDGSSSRPLSTEATFDDFEASGANVDAGVARQSKRRGVTIIVASVFAALIVALVAAFFAARWYYSDKAAPGVYLGDVSVAGQNASQLEQTVIREADNSKITVSDGQGRKVTAGFKDFGVNVDVKKTVQGLLDAKGDGAGRVSPFGKTNIKLDAKVADLPVNKYLTDTFVQDNDKAVPSAIAFKGGNEFVVHAGRGGRAPEMAGVKRSLNDLIAQPGQTQSVTVAYKDVPAPVSEQNAQATADSANKILANPIVINNGDTGKFQIPVEQIAAWIKPETDLEKGAISLDIDKTAIANYLNSEVPKRLNRDMASQEDIIDGSGQVLLTMKKGVNGVKVKDCGPVVDQVYSALTGSQPATIQAPADITKFDVKQTKPQMRLVVDKSAQTVTVYKDDQQVQTFPVCTGRAGHETTPGTYVINVRYDVQTMRGADYVTPNVPWVSYFNGSQGFHGAPWNPTGIGMGDPASHGSHGCVNMNVQDAKWIYDNCPQGSLVQVVGSQPGGPVR